MREPSLVRSKGKESTAEVNMSLEDIIRAVVRDAVREALKEAELKPAISPDPHDNEPAPDVKAYSVVDAAHQLGISRSRLYELIADGELETIQIGRRRLVPAAALDRLLAALAEPRAGDCRFCGRPAVATYRRDGDQRSDEIRLCSSGDCHQQLVDTVTR